ncbi:NSP2 [Rotavirus L]|nr:NSP2 [Rotavirus L]
MASRVGVADFVVKVKDGEWGPSNVDCEALDRFNSVEEKDLRTKFKMERADKATVRKEMLFTAACSRRITQTGIVPLPEIRTKTRVPTAVKCLITKWLLGLLNDEDNGKEIEQRLKKKMTDVFFSSDKLSRLCMRLEDETDLIHDPVNSLNALLVATNSIDSTIVTEGKCDIVRATEDAIIAKFDPIPEHFLIGKQRKTFYKCFPVEKKTAMLKGAAAMLAISNRDLIMFHGHGHLRTIPYHEIEDAIYSFSKKDKNELREIRGHVQTPAAGERFKIILDMLESGSTVKEITTRIQQYYRNRQSDKKSNDE